MKHPHHELFEAIVRNESVNDFECLHTSWTNENWRSARGWLDFIDQDPDEWAIRRKQKQRELCGVKFPEPMRVAPAVGTHYWIVSVSEEFSYSSTWAGDKSDFYCLERGLCQSTKEAAELHRKALILVSGGTP